MGIIGVVAAMTLPAVVNHFRVVALESQFKKAYTVVQQVVLTAKADSGIDKFAKYCADVAAGYYQDPDNVDPYPNYSQCYELLNYAFTRSNTNSTWTKDDYTVNRKQDSLRTYNNSGIINVSGAGAEHWTMRRGKDGMLVQFRINEGRLSITVDTNGLKKPNRYGHDIFLFYVNKSNDAVVGMKQERVYTQEELDSMTDKEDWQVDRAGTPCSAKSTQLANGIGCAWFAINDINPDTGLRGYWKNLPK